MSCVTDRGRWSQAVAALYLQVGAGLQDAFSVYSFEYRQALGLSEFQLAGLASAKDAGNALFGLAFGFAFDDTPAAGPILASAALNVVGFTALLASFSGTLHLSYPLQCCAFACAYACGSGYALGGLKYTFANYADVRGLVAGFLKPMDGLSAALYTQASCVLGLSVPAFLRLQACVPPLTAVAVLPLLRKHLETEDSVAERIATVHTFEVAAGVTLLLALSLLALALLEVPRTAGNDASMSTLRLLALLPLALLASYGALPALHDWWRSRGDPVVTPGADAKGSLPNAESVPLVSGGTSRGYAALEVVHQEAKKESPSVGLPGSVAMTAFGSCCGTGDAGGDDSVIGDDLDPAQLACCTVSQAQPHDTLSPPGEADETVNPGGGNQPQRPAASSSAGDGDGEDAVFGSQRFYVARSSTVSEALMEWDWWLTTGIYVLNNAITGAALNNTSPLLASLGVSPVLAPVLIAVASCSNCLGRIVGGQVSERTLFGFTAAEYYRPPPRLLRTVGPASAAAAKAVLAAGKGGVPRSAWVFLNCCIQATGCAALACASSSAPSLLFVGLPLVTAAYGSQNTLLVSVYHERFGHRHYGALLGCAGLCILPVSVLLSMVLASALYDAAALRQGQTDGYCTGTDCFRPFLLCLAALAALNAGLAALHWSRFSRFYRLLASRRAEDLFHKLA